MYVVDILNIFQASLLSAKKCSHCCSILILDSFLLYCNYMNNICMLNSMFIVYVCSNLVHR